MSVALAQIDLDRPLTETAGRLVSRLRPGGWFEGRLSTSALSTALAVFALSRLERGADAPLIEAGLSWLAANINDDGGFGDTDDSPGNLSTTLLALCAFRTVADKAHAAVAKHVEQWIAGKLGSLEPETIRAAVTALYGEDRTFSAPILTVCALGGLLGGEPECWKHVPQLPFELAAAPRALLGHLRLQVVSYALPALVAIGLARHVRSKDRSLLRPLRSALARRGVAVVQGMQGETGGFLEATPLTAFVVAGLAAAGLAGHEIVARGRSFLLASMRPDGGWPIDTNLSTWVTTLSVNALADAGLLESMLSGKERSQVAQWLLGQQHSRRNPFTNARPGGWAWTDLPGGVPDADDTAGALLALSRLDGGDAAAKAAARGVRWLLDLQNSDGGFPTFCRGWGRLPFDRSCPDITAHVVAAFAAWAPLVPPKLARRIAHASGRAARHLAASQNADGSWLPLWFGNQYAPGHANPTYGTAQVVTALADAAPGGRHSGMIEAGCRWLIASHNDAGGWGGAAGVAGTVEETALALRALAGAGRRAGPEVASAATWLIEASSAQSERHPAPIGLYFASLWYSEELYPLIFTTSALGRLQRCGRGAAL